MINVFEVLSFEPKQPTRGKFDEMSFLADFNHCLTELGDADADTINELNAAAIRYRTRAKKDKGSRTVDRAKMFSKKNGLKAVPFDKGTGFWILSALALV